MALALRLSICFPAGKEALAWQAELQRLLPSAAVDIWQAQTTNEQADYAVVWQPSQAFLDAQTQLKAIFNAGAGVDALLKLRLPAAPLVRLEDAGMGTQMAQYVAHAVLHHFRRFDVYAAHASHGQWSQHGPRREADFPIGIMGYGVLGKAIAHALTALGFTVHAWARSAAQNATIPVFHGAAQLPNFLARTRLLVCALPLTPETRHIVCRDTLAQLLPKAYFINIARGGHVNEADLLAALASGTLAGATLDVCENEPAGADHPFWQHPLIRLTPHISAVTLRQDAMAQIVGKIAALESGSPISGVVDLAKSY